MLLTPPSLPREFSVISRGRMRDGCTRFVLMILILLVELTPFFQYLMRIFQYQPVKPKLEVNAKCFHERNPNKIDKLWSAAQPPLLIRWREIRTWLQWSTPQYRSTSGLLTRGTSPRLSACLLPRSSLETSSAVS